MAKTEAIIFDLFGVVLNDSLGQMLDELARTDPKGVVEVWDLIHQVSRGMIDREDSNRQVAAIFGMTVDEYRQRVAAGEVRNTQLLELISQLRGTYKTAILSNISKGGLSRRFSSQELDKYFDVVVGSADVGMAKPDLEVYRLTATRLGVEPARCIFTDDKSDFCEAAIETGMRAIHYTDFASFKTQLERLLAQG
ncbi:HAD-IA family hydrolase [Candidatus Saccharibacteria bacterium]|nr:HAD-IA family hydrolase [Candidatus Saccharibacteria bacterium]